MSSEDDSECFGLMPTVSNGQWVDPPGGDRHALGTVLTARCRPNHRAAATGLSSVCAPEEGAPAFWKPDAIVCEPGPCPDPRVLPHGAAVVNPDCEGFRYECDAGYRLEGTASHDCENGVWRPRPNAQCVRITCPDPTGWTLSHGKVRYGTMVLQVVGSGIEFVCDEGYGIAGGGPASETGARRAKRRCGLDGRWDGPVPTCERVAKASSVPKPGGTAKPSIAPGEIGNFVGKCLGGLAVYVLTIASALVMFLFFWVRRLSRCRSCVSRNSEK